MTDTCILVDYGSGNLRSAEKALDRAARDGALDGGRDITVRVSSDPAVVKSADRLVLPGVGAFADCRNGLLAIDGMRDAIQHVVRAKGNPFLGICVGMQLMAKEGHEFGVHKGMGWIDGVVEPMQVPAGLKVPHMGWNDITLSEEAQANPVASALKTGDHLYFVHSYHMVMTGDHAPLATTDYGGPVTALVGHDTMIGAQFHPEKSQAAGLKFLQAFLNWTP